MPHFIYTYASHHKRVASKSQGKSRFRGVYVQSECTTVYIYEPSETGTNDIRRNHGFRVPLFSFHTRPGRSFRSLQQPTLSYLYIFLSSFEHPSIQEMVCPYSQLPRRQAPYRKKKAAAAPTAKTEPAATREAPAVGMGVGAPVGLVLLPAPVVARVVGTPAL